MKKLIFALVGFFIVTAAEAQCPVSITPTTPTVCVGQSVVLTASGSTSYTWSANAGSANTVSVSVSPTVATTYTVVGQSGACLDSTSVTVNVNTPPTVTVNSATICAGQTTGTLTAGGATTYTWNPATGLSSSTGSTVTANPSSTTSYTVTGTAANGCTNSAATTVVVNAVPTVSVNSATVCTGTSATLTATGASTYNWSPGSGLSSTSGAVVFASPSSNTNYTVTGTTVAGCTNTAVSVVTVATSPTVVVSSATLCTGSSATLTASGATSYTWTPATSLNTNVGATVVASPTTNTSYTVTGASAACTATAVATVTVLPLPVITINQPTLCASYSTVLSPTGAVSYTWTTGSTASSLTVSPTITTSYTVFGTGTNGCTNFTVSTVTVFPSPTTTVNSTAICSGSTILTAGGATTYTWSVNAGSVTTNTVQVTPSSTTVYTVVGGFANSCTIAATSTVYVNSSTVSITPPAVSGYCTDNPYQFTGTANPGPILFWQWSATPSAGVTIQSPNQNGTNITFSQVGNYVLTLKANNSLGCVDSVMFPLSVTQTPTVTATPVAPIICLGGPGTTLFASVTPNNGPTTYTWTGNSLIQYGNGDSAKINPPSPGTYTYVVVGTQNGCESQPVTITATVNPAPTPTVLATTDTICAGQTTNITSIGMPSNTSYTWTAPSTGGLGTNSGFYTWVTPVYAGMSDTSFIYQTDFYVPGCPPYPSYTTAVVVRPVPVIKPVADTVDNCNKMGDSLRITSVPSLTAGVTYTWTPSAGLNWTTGTTVFANPTNETWYYITPELNGCVGRTDSILVRIGDTTSANIDAQYLIICQGQSDTLVALPQLGQLNSSYQYSWLPSIGPNVPVPINANGDTVVITPVATQIYTLTVTGTCVKRPKTTVTIYVNNCAPTVPSFTMNTDTICVNHCIYFEDLTYQTGNVLPLFYEWIFTGGTPVGISGQYTVVLPDTAYYAATDSTPIPSIKVCYKINSTLNQNGVFPVTLNVSHGVGTATNTVTQYVRVDPGPLSNAGPNVTIDLGDSTQLNGTMSTGNFAITQYSWSPTDSLHCDIPPYLNNWSCPRPWANPSETTTYYLTVRDQNGCYSKDSMTVYVELKCFDPFVPSAFSPNGDGQNDILYVRSNCLQKFVFQVFDRWGEKVFETTTLDYGWDGTFRGLPVNAGVFVWTLEGFLFNGKETRQHGSTTVIR